MPGLGREIETGASKARNRRSWRGSKLEIKLAEESVIRSYKLSVYQQGEGTRAMEVTRECYRKVIKALDPCVILICILTSLISGARAYESVRKIHGILNTP